MNPENPADRWLDELPPPAWAMAVVVEVDPLEDLALVVDAEDEVGC